MNNFELKLLRNKDLYASLEEAYEALESFKGGKDGTPVLARYLDDNDNIDTLMGVISEKDGKRKVSIFNPNYDFGTYGDDVDDLPNTIYWDARRIDDSRAANNSQQGSYDSNGYLYGDTQYDMRKPVGAQYLFAGTQYLLVGTKYEPERYVWEDTSYNEPLNEPIKITASPYVFDPSTLKNITNYSGMFGIWNNNPTDKIINYFYTLDLSKMDVSNVVNFAYMFSGCYDLRFIDMSGWDMSKAETTNQMFVRCHDLVKVKVQGCPSKTQHKLLNELNTSCEYEENPQEYILTNGGNYIHRKDYFDGDIECDYNGGALTGERTIKWEPDNTALYLFDRTLGDPNLLIAKSSPYTLAGSYKVMNTLSGMFHSEDLTSLDLSKFDTSNVTNMNSMFNGCSSLTSLDLSNFDTSKVTDMNWMFNGCSSLTSLDLSKFDTSKVTDMNWMFNGCSSLTEVKVANCSDDTKANLLVQLGEGWVKDGDYLRKPSIS